MIFCVLSVTLDDYDVLLEFLSEENHRWMMLGTMLRVDYGTNEELAAAPTPPCSVYMRTMLHQWKTGKFFTWDKLQRALKNIGYNALAVKLVREGHSTGPGMWLLL